MNVVELAPLRPVRHRMGKSYVEAYIKHFPVSEPREDQEDRNALYCLYVVDSSPLGTDTDRDKSLGHELLNIVSGQSSISQDVNSSCSYPSSS